MRRIIYPLLAGIALLGVVVTPALARQHDHRAHERRHHERRHHERAHHHARIRHRTFGTAAGSGPGSGGTTSTSNDNAGTVSSFTNGVLTIALQNGSMVSGAVTRGTEIECRGNMTQAEDPGDNDAGESAGERAHDEHSGGRDSSSGDDNPGAGDDARGENDNPGDDNDNNDEMQNCSSSALQQGTVVREAELALGSGGARWDKVELLSAATGGSEDS